MRNTLISIAAWSIALAVVLWQRAIWPGLKSFLPGIDDLATDIRTDIQPPASSESGQIQAAGHATEPAPTPAREPIIPTAQPAHVETYVIERKPAPVRTARPAPKRAAKPAAGFAS